MVGLRKFLSVINLLVLWFLIGAFGIIFIISQILQQSVIKKWIAEDSGYTKITNAIKTNISNSGGAEKIDVNSQKILDQISPQLVQTQVELVIDQYFSWMKGEKAVTSLSTADLNSQLLGSMNLSTADLPPESQQIIPEIKLPLISDASLSKMKTRYNIIFVYQPYLLGIIGLLMLLMIAYRFKFRDRMAWLVWSVFVPFIGVATSFLMLMVLKKYFLSTDSVLGALPEAMRTIVYQKLLAFLNLMYLAELQLVLVELGVVVVLFVVYLIAKHFSVNTVLPVAAPVATPVTPATPVPAAIQPPQAPPPAKEDVKVEKEIPKK